MPPALLLRACWTCLFALLAGCAASTLPAPTAAEQALIRQAEAFVQGKGYTQPPPKATSQTFEFTDTKVTFKDELHWPIVLDGQNGTLTPCAVGLRKAGEKDTWAAAVAFRFVPNGDETKRKSKKGWLAAVESDGEVRMLRPTGEIDEVEVGNRCDGSAQATAE